MKKYSHDYTLVQEAMDCLYSATRLHANECYSEALERINEARTTLQQYLSQENMVPDDDVEGGWVRAIDVDEAIVRTFLRTDDVNIGRVPVCSSGEWEELDASVSVFTTAKVVRHGQIDRQYRQQLDGVGNPDCPLYGKVVRITGTFDQIGMSRDEVAAACQRMGAKSASEGVCKSMDIVVIGNNPGPTKQQKIEQWRSEGHDIKTVSQFDFKEIVNKYDVR